MIDQQLEGCISYQKTLLGNCKLVGAISNQALIEETIRYLEELRKIKEEEPDECLGG